MSTGGYFKNVVAKRNPLAARVLVFLRHTCPDQYITDAGWVHLGTVSWYLKASRNDILSAVAIDDNVDRFDIKNHYIRANAAHTIAKVHESKLFSTYEPEPGETAYFTLRVTPNHTYNEGSDLEPMLGRTSTFFNKTDKGDPMIHYAVLEIDLCGLAEHTPVYDTGANSGFAVRGSIPARYITMRKF